MGAHDFKCQLGRRVFLCSEPLLDLSLPTKLNEKLLGDDLLSRTVSSQVPSVLGGLTAGFGMGTGCTPAASNHQEAILHMKLSTE